MQGLDFVHQVPPRFVIWGKCTINNKDNQSGFCALGTAKISHLGHSTDNNNDKAASPPSTCIEISTNVGINQIKLKTTMSD